MRRSFGLSPGLSPLDRIVWFNPTDNQGVRFILPAVERREPWTNEEE